MTATPPTDVRGEKPRQAPQTGAAERIGEQRIASYHEYTRTKGVNFPLYSVARLFLLPFFLVWFRLDRIGREHAKLDGGLIVAANHRSFLDPFVMGALLPWRRPIHYVAKMELFEKRWLLWIFVFSVLLPNIANQVGWFAAEMGRQPWVVYGLLRTSDALSKSVKAEQVLFSLILFSLVYLLLLTLFLYLLNKKIVHGPEHLEMEEERPRQEAMFNN